MIYLQSVPCDPHTHHKIDNHPSYRTIKPADNNIFPPLPGEMRKKIENYSFLLSDRIGKGYSSTVYKGLDDLTGTFLVIQDSRSPSK